MEKFVFHVEGMSCQHCVKAVTDAVRELPGVKEISVELLDKTATVVFDPAQVSLEKIKEEIEDQGYEVI
ncbi:MAG: copper chaperone CopZ [Eubacteriales bacterium]|nr:copper chaperone CopZ [Eubacteriales bacterium]MDD4390823.1 copper chaperone CopZ [Eubacteriales bacterium]